MRRLIPNIALGALATIPTSLFFTQPARAGLDGDYCYPVAHIYQSAADHPGAYKDGYVQGRQSASKRESYKPRTAGGEFAQGFEDGYYGRSFAGQKHFVPDTVQYYASGPCDNFSLDDGYDDFPSYREHDYPFHPFYRGHGSHAFYGGHHYR